MLTPLQMNSVSIPVGSPLKRNIRRELQGNALVEYENGKLGQYDERTIFYDVFIKDDRRTIVAIGPPLLNLAERLLPIDVKAGDVRIKMRQTENYKKLCVFEAKLPKPQGTGDLQVELIFSDAFSQTMELKTGDAFYPKGKTLVTLQKNNEIRWIRDWILYYRKAFNVEHVFIYDNNSTYQDQLPSLLSLENVYVIPGIPLMVLRGDLAINSVRWALLIISTGVMVAMLSCLILILMSY